MYRIRHEKPVLYSAVLKNKKDQKFDLPTDVK